MWLSHKWSLHPRRAKDLIPILQRYPLQAGAEGTGDRAGEGKILTHCDE